MTSQRAVCPLRTAFHRLKHADASRGRVGIALTVVVIAFLAVRSIAVRATTAGAALRPLERKLY
jgi:hypothetical protein